MRGDGGWEEMVGVVVIVCRGDGGASDALPCVMVQPWGVDR